MSGLVASAIIRQFECKLAVLKPPNNSVMWLKPLSRESESLQIARTQSLAA